MALEPTAARTFHHGGARVDDEMIELLTDERGFPHFLAALVLLSRIGDVPSTYLLSPTLLLAASSSLVCCSCGSAAEGPSGITGSA
jgi:hypothetical protein